MFKPTEAKTPKEYIAMIDDEKRQSEIQKIHDFITKEVPDLKAHIESGMIGYGSEHYRTKSGREGEWPVLMLSSRKNYIAIYSSCYESGKYITEKYKDKIGKSDIGKSCMRFKKFEDIDFDGLKELILESAKIAKDKGIFA